jgi:hypothetical protein
LACHGAAAVEVPEIFIEVNPAPAPRMPSDPAQDGISSLA